MKDSRAIGSVGGATRLLATGTLVGGVSLGALTAGIPGPIYIAPPEPAGPLKGMVGGDDNTERYTRPVLSYFDPGFETFLGSILPDEQAYPVRRVSWEPSFSHRVTPSFSNTSGNMYNVLGFQDAPHMVGRHNYVQPNFAVAFQNIGGAANYTNDRNLPSAPYDALDTVRWRAAMLAVGCPQTDVSGQRKWFPVRHHSPKVVTAGAGYAVGNELALDGLNGAKVRVGGVNGTGGITEYWVSHPGGGMDALPSSSATTTAITGSGSGAVLNLYWHRNAACGAAMPNEEDSTGGDGNCYDYNLDGGADPLTSIGRQTNASRQVAMFLAVRDEMKSGGGRYTDFPWPGLLSGMSNAYPVMTDNTSASTSNSQRIGLTTYANVNNGQVLEAFDLLNGHNHNFWSRCNYGQTVLASNVVSIGQMWTFLDLCNSLRVSNGKPQILLPVITDEMGRFITISGSYEGTSWGPLEANRRYLRELMLGAWFTHSLYWGLSSAMMFSVIGSNAGGNDYNLIGHMQPVTDADFNDRTIQRGWAWFCEMIRPDRYDLFDDALFPPLSSIRKQIPIKAKTWNGPVPSGLNPRMGGFNDPQGWSIWVDVSQTPIANTQPGGSASGNPPWAEWNRATIDDGLITMLGSSTSHRTIAEHPIWLRAASRNYRIGATVRLSGTTGGKASIVARGYNKLAGNQQSAAEVTTQSGWTNIYTPTFVHVESGRPNPFDPRYVLANVDFNGLGKVEVRDTWVEEW